MTSRLPKYCARDFDRHGNARIYFRRKGCKKVRIRAPLDSAEFWQEYSAAMAMQAEPSARKARAGTMRALFRAYLESREFKDKAPTTRSTRRRVLDRLDAKIGDFDYTLVTADHVEKWRDAPDQVEAGNHIVKVLRAVFKHAGVKPNPAAVPYRSSKNPDGYAVWSEGDIRQFVKRHPRGTMAHKALCIFLFTGQRLSDVRRLGPQHVRGDYLEFTQYKNMNGKPIHMAIPIIESLRAVLNDPPSHQMAFITSERAIPFQSDASLGNRFIKWCKEAGLEGRSAHGLRKACATFLAERGRTHKEIMSITGHTTHKEVDRYAKGASQRRIATSTMSEVGSEFGALIEPNGHEKRPTGA